MYSAVLSKKDSMMYAKVGDRFIVANTSPNDSSVFKFVVKVRESFYQYVLPGYEELI